MVREQARSEWGNNKKVSNWGPTINDYEVSIVQSRSDFKSIRKILWNG